MDSELKIGLVVANGTLPSPELLSSLLAHNPFVLAADGGANKLLERGIVPDAVLGDFDSLDTALPEIVRRVPAIDQNFTDLDKSVAHLLSLGFESIWLVGATGDRLDHTFGALSVLAKYSKAAQMLLFDDAATAQLVDGTLELATEAGQTISLLALGEVTGITTTGLRWNLNNESLAPGIRDGISNEAVGEQVSITSRSGPLIAYIFHT